MSDDRRPTRVLLAEDEESFVDALVIGLEREGFSVTVARHADGEALALETDHECVDEGVLVFGEEHAGWSMLVAHVSLRTRIGRRNVKVAPSPSRESTWTLPWWFCATWRTIESPSPVPPVDRPRPWSTR